DVPVSHDNEIDDVNRKQFLTDVIGVGVEALSAKQVTLTNTVSAPTAHYRRQGGPGAGLSLLPDEVRIIGWADSAVEPGGAKVVKHTCRPAFEFIRGQSCEERRQRHAGMSDQAVNFPRLVHEADD